MIRDGKSDLAASWQIVRFFWLKAQNNTVGTSRHAVYELIGLPIACLYEYPDSKFISAESTDSSHLHPLIQQRVDEL